jgi:pescadillo protein
VDPKLEEAAAELASIMQDLAAPAADTRKQQQQQQPLLQQQEQQVQEHDLQQATGDRLAEGGGAAPAEVAVQEAVASNGMPGSDSDDEGPGEVDVGAEPSSSDDEEGLQHEADEHAADQAGSFQQQEQEQDASDQPLSALIPSTATTASRVHPQATHLVHASAGGALGVEPDDEAAICERLFRGLVFFLGREVPREQLLFVIRAFGGVAGWAGEGSPVQENDESITHQVVDRPTQGHRFLSREYVQPQWVVDSANFRVLAPTELYVPGKTPPPHLSPFAANDDDADAYVPDYLSTMRKLQEAARQARKRSASTMEDATFVGEALEANAQQTGAADEQDSAEQQFQTELLKELKGTSEEAQDDQEAQDEQEPQRKPQQPAASVDLSEEPHAAIMMTRKAKGLYNAMQRGIKAKRQRVDELERKKQALAHKAA